jgi:hypothetical protein
MGSGCLGDGELAFDKNYNAVFTPYEDASGPDGWHIELNGIHLADVVEDAVDHSQDTFIQELRYTNEYACSGLADRPPRPDCF